MNDDRVMDKAHLGTEDLVSAADEGDQMVEGRVDDVRRLGYVWYHGC